MTTIDVFLENLGVKLLGFGIVAGEALLVVRNVDSTIRGTLEGTKEAGSSGSPLKTNIEVGLEWAGSILLIKTLGQDELTIGLSDTLVLVGKTELGEGTAGDKEAGSVSFRCD